MQHKKALKLAGFVGALAASATLVSVSVSSTGAYFTDSHTGSINATAGTVKVDTSDLTLSYTNLLPGDYKSQNVHYTATGSGNEDIWLVFPSTGAEMLGVPANPNSLGRYGHFQVDSAAGSFVSNNLTDDATPETPEPHCYINADGHGGDANVASYPYQGAPSNQLTVMPYCAPKPILLDSNVAPGAQGDATVTFGITRVYRSGQGLPVGTGSVAFNLVATQHGVRPDDVNNPNS